ncbi:CBS domain-containing protein [Brooklawnia sp.]|uniref:CBS domain-containing protein n=1 Tax=Brooklawnia sp. TaxID=2699740 RepID=UPI00311EA49D
MRVYDVLKHKGHDVVVASPDATVAELLQLLVEHRIGSVVVVDDGRPVGLVAERDIVSALAAADDDVRTHLVREVMESIAHVAALDDDTADLAATMTEFRIRHLPVVDQDGKLLAIVSIGDVVKARLDTLTDERDHLINYVQQ